jgi:hypothetical protein
MLSGPFTPCFTISTFGGNISALRSVTSFAVIFGFMYCALAVA